MRLLNPFYLIIFIIFFQGCGRAIGPPVNLKSEMIHSSAKIGITVLFDSGISTEWYCRSSNRREGVAYSVDKDYCKKKIMENFTRKISRLMPFQFIDVSHIDPKAIRVAVPERTIY